MTDGLVEAAAQQGLGDDALVGVLAHEIGHVVHRHTTRMLVEQARAERRAGPGARATCPASFRSGGSLLTGLSYRRNHETEADCFAAALMRKAQLSTEPMADLLLGMEKERKEAPEDGAMLGGLFSSHPAAALRAQQFKQGRLEGC